MKSSSAIVPGRASTFFATTHWSLVLVAARPENPGSQDAFARLYADYWLPLHSYLRRRGLSPEESEDVAQDFFAALLEKNRLAGLEQAGGRFRSFLLTALQNFLANAWDRSQAQKRGGGQQLVSLDDLSLEFLDLADANPTVTPESLFERQWALSVLDHARQALAEEQQAAGRELIFKHLLPHLQSDQTDRPYADIATELGLSEGAVKVAVHRLRHRFGEILRAEIARTVSSEAEIQEELRHLINAVSA